MKKNINDVKKLDKQQMNAIQGGKAPKIKNNFYPIEDEETPL
jgi:hypothetical protein